MLTNKGSIAIVLVAILSSQPSLIQARGDDASAARVAEHVVCRALFSGDGTAQVICYVAFAEGLPSRLFAGPPSEATAFFTLRSDTISGEPIVNGNVVVVLQSAGTYSVYFNSTPHGDWNDPDSFSSGQLVATFKRTPPLLVNVGTMANAFFSARLLDTNEFVLHGRTFDFRRIVPNRLTWILTAAANPISGPPGFAAAQAFAGSALAIGDAAGR
jgi:hypothetical protein